MEYIVPSWEIVKCLCHCIDYPPCSNELQEILPSLETKMKSLTAVYEGVMEKVELEEEHQRKRSPAVSDWIKRVESMKKEIADLVVKSKREIQNKCPGTRLPLNCLASSKLEKMVREKMDAVEEMKSEASSFQELTQPQRPVAIKFPLVKTEGLDLLFEEVWKCLEDDRVRLIGIYGIGGVGKTTLLTMVNNEFLKTSLSLKFEVVIWAEVSQHAIEEVQEKILKRLEIPGDTWKHKGKGERAIEILRVLEKKNFLLLLDEIWQWLDLLNVLGIPSVDSEHKSKVIFTTRCERVCRLMGPQKSIRVQCLAWEKALTLFGTTVGEAASSAHISHFAKHIVQECSGLPSALNIIGTHMKAWTELHQWEYQLNILRHCPSEIPGMKNDLFPRLAKSCDMLDNTVKSCFLYCSMFPSDKEIFCDELIQLWMGEGFLDQYDEPRAKGEGIIEQLCFACLLEIGSFKKHVKMHRMIRAMALWLACKKGEKMNKCVVREDGKLIEPVQVAKWNEAQRIALWHCGIEANRTPPSFSKLETLFVSNNSIESFPSGFLGDMPVIRVLDLSNSKLIKLPDEIGCLVNLRYLNFSRTKIKELPTNLENLVNLRFLILDETDYLPRIPSQILSKLLCLQLLSIFRSKASEGDCTLLLNELELLKHMSDLSIKLTNVLPTKKLLNSRELRKVIRQLCLQGCKDMKLVELSPSIQMLEMNNCLDLEGVLVDVENHGGNGSMPQNIVPSKFPQQHFLYTLCQLNIFMCPKLLNLTWLIHIPRLQSLDVGACDSMEVVIDDKIKVLEIEQEVGMFSRLTTLNLYNLPNLQSICRHALPFPSLTSISVAFCQSLRKLPLDSKTNAKTSLQKINGDQRWWDDLVWEDNNIKGILAPYFVAHDNNASSSYATQGAGCSSSTIPISGI